MNPQNTTAGASSSQAAHTPAAAQQPEPPTLEEVVHGLMQIRRDINRHQADPSEGRSAPSPSAPSTPHPGIHQTPPHLYVQPPTRSALKPSVPPTYNGDRATGRAFLNTCDAYYSLRPEDFRDTQTRIHWVLTYMTADRAGKWTDRVYTWERQNPGTPRFATWEDFETAFKREFFPRDPEQVAMNRLDTEAYWQRGRTLDAYLDEFYDLVCDANLEDQQTLVRRFRRGLKPSVQTEIATRYKDKPADDNLEAWIEAARCIEDSHAANAAFLGLPAPSKPFATAATPRRHVSNPHVSFASATRAPQTFSAPTVPSQGLTAPSTPNAPSNASRTSPSSRWAHQTPSAGNPVPMDIDAARKKGELPPVCHCCGRPGHFVAECTQRHDVRILEDVRAQLDLLIARTEAVFNFNDQTPEDPAPAVEDAEETEDFPSSNE
ncbi:hypothetical protein CVT24_004677 [Panaeolus cyanescens]|uniref:CCHC-type domain-containing protein n=1 Tax=Panaeolus cyanescens TaxID=181874 RepID=A0A409X6P5_9AGAR|nr:hypothetical protein CVT24_004677 [Panaeolus cyanescens]